MGWSEQPSVFMTAVREEVDEFFDEVALDGLATVKRLNPVALVNGGTSRGGWTIENQGKTRKITNNVIYITALEDGHSQQAPNGMAGITADILKQKYGLTEIKVTRES